MHQLPVSVCREKCAPVSVCTAEAQCSGFHSHTGFIMHILGDNHTSFPYKNMNFYMEKITHHQWYTCTRYLVLVSRVCKNLYRLPNWRIPIRLIVWGPCVFLSDSCLHAWHPSKKKKKKEMHVPLRMVHLHLSSREEAIKSFQESRPCQRRGSEMTTVTFVFLILFTGIVSSGTWLRLEQCTDLSQYGHNEETKSLSSIVSHKKAVIHDKTKLKCERWVNHWYITVLSFFLIFSTCILSLTCFFVKDLDTPSVVSHRFFGRELVI